jgi:hypothetical protein
MDGYVNFGKTRVSTGYDASATSIVLASGDGARLPSSAYNATWWNGTDYPDPADDPNREIVRVTAGFGTDTLTVTRAQEGTSASTKNTAGKTYRLLASPTTKLIDDILASIPGSVTTPVLVREQFVATSGQTAFSLSGTPSGAVLALLEGIPQAASFGSASGSTYTAASGQTVGANVSFVYYTTAPTGQTPTVESFSGDGVTTDFALAHVPAVGGLLLVAAGPVLAPAAYSLIAPQTIRISAAPAVTVVVFYTR